MISTIITDTSEPVIPINIVEKKHYAAWLHGQSEFNRNWLATQQFKAEAGQVCLLPDANGKPAQVITSMNEQADRWSLAHLPKQLPSGVYTFSDELPTDVLQQATLAWGLATYQFNKYKAAGTTRQPQLKLSSTCDAQYIEQALQSLYWVRDLINTPAEDMHPEALAEEASQLAKRFHAQCKLIAGDKLLKANYPAIHTVGRAAKHPPVLIDLQWGDKKHPLITLVGKGVCFDTGGLDLKTTNGMALMKKDMGGAAHVLGLAQLIMAQQLPVQLRVLIPSVENAVSSNAYRPGDVITMRSGKTVEVTNTDAEGRLVLADCLTAACEQEPEVLIDFATLTGAARVALGTEIPVMFSNDDNTANAIVDMANKTQDNIWRLPLHKPYLKLLHSNIADLKNSDESPYGGAITAALFLQEFVASRIPWVHLDMMAWNLANQPGRPMGGEAMGLLTLFEFVRSQYK